MWVGRIPHEVWGWRATALVVIAVVTPQIAVQQLVPEVRNLSGAAAVSALLVFPLIGLAAVLLYLHWRLTASQGTAWVAACLAIIGVNGATFAGLRLGAVDDLEHRPGWLLVLDLAVTAALLVMVLLAERVPVPADPMAIGLSVGLCVTEVDLLVSKFAAPTEASAQALILGDSILLGLGIGIAYAIARLTTIPRWASSRLALTVVLLCVNRAVSGDAVPDAAVFSVIGLTSGLIGAVLLGDTSLALLRQAIRDDRREVRSLHNQLATLEAEGRADREKLHEIKGSIAGIASATRLIRHAEELPAPGRNRLEEMLEAETSRLERLVRAVDADAAVEETRVDLDKTIGPVVLAHRAQGRVVRWQPSGQTAHGRRDDIAEVINILLDNAAKHAPRSAAGVEVRRQNGTIEIAVSDDGPGVSPAVESQLFNWGAHGPESPGEGIGLNVAYRLMNDNGTYLRLVDSAASGATFVVGLRAAGEDRDAADSIAQ